MIRYFLTSLLLPTISIGAVASYLLSAPAAVGATAALVTAGSFVMRPQLIARAVGGSFDASYEVALDAVRMHKPDVLVGFSWGGALVCRLLVEGEYAGPVLLLAPAYRKLYMVMQRPVAPVPLPEQIKVVHSQADQIIAIEDSRALCRAAGIEVMEVQGEPHKLWGICNQLATMVLDLGNQRK